MIPVSLVTPSTILAMLSPKRSRTSSIEAEVSSTVSCSSAAHSVSVSSRMPAQIRATPTGCTMKSSPERRRWSAWCSQAKTKASSTRARSISTEESGACSETIANRSSSSRRSTSVRSARAVGAGIEPRPFRPRGGGPLSSVGREAGVGSPVLATVLGYGTASAN